MNDKEAEQKFSELLKVMARLRGETGWPWDQEQKALVVQTRLL